MAVVILLLSAVVYASASPVANPCGGCCCNMPAPMMMQAPAPMMALQAPAPMMACAPPCCPPQRIHHLHNLEKVVVHQQQAAAPMMPAPPVPAPPPCTVQSQQHVWECAPASSCAPAPIISAPCAPPCAPPAAPVCMPMQAPYAMQAPCSSGCFCKKSPK